MRMHEGRRHQFDSLAGQLEVFRGERRGGGEEGGDGRTH